MDGSSWWSSAPEAGSYLLLLKKTPVLETQPGSAWGGEKKGEGSKIKYTCFKLLSEL